MTFSLIAQILRTLPHNEGFEIASRSTSQFVSLMQNWVTINPFFHSHPQKSTEMRSW